MAKVLNSDGLSHLWEKIKALIPTKTSDLTNDSNYITSAQAPVQSVDGATGAVMLNDVKYTTQSLTTAQKTQARTNIGAGTSSFDGDYNSLSNKPDIPSKTSDLTNDSGFISELPIASSTVLGAIKVGGGLAITNAGVLSATGGGTADAVEWDNVLDKPTTIAGYGITDAKITDKTITLGTNTVIVPTQTSQLTNNSGYITSASVPTASTSTPKMDGTASVGSETKWARGDHVHPSDTSKLDVDGGTATAFTIVESMKIENGSHGATFGLTADGLSMYINNNTSTVGTTILTQIGDPVQKNDAVNLNYLSNYVSFLTNEEIDDICT